LLSGSLALLELRKKVEKWKLGEILGRYMLTDFVYRGLQSESELHDVLAAFDTTLFPQNSQTTLAAHFLAHTGVAPIVASWTPAMWDEFKIIWKECKQPGNLDLPMKSVSVALSNLLVSSNADGATMVTDEAIRDAARKANLPSLLRARKVVEEVVEDVDE
jgi:hypothetical protein